MFFIGTYRIILRAAMITFFLALHNFHLCFRSEMFSFILVHECGFINELFLSYLQLLIVNEYLLNNNIKLFNLRYSGQLVIYQSY